MIHPLFSTIHKAKGKEFENIFLLLNDPLKNKEDKRIVYVAIQERRTICKYTTLKPIFHS
jgi:hypothetical protein